MLKKLLTELKGCSITLVVYSHSLRTVAQNVEAEESLVEFVNDVIEGQKEEEVNLLEYCVFAFNFLPDGISFSSTEAAKNRTIYAPLCGIDHHAAAGSGCSTSIRAYTPL